MSLPFNNDITESHIYIFTWRKIHPHILSEVFVIGPSYLPLSPSFSVLKAHNSWLIITQFVGQPPSSLMDPKPFGIETVFISSVLPAYHSSLHTKINIWKNINSKGFKQIFHANSATNS